MGGRGIGTSYCIGTLIACDAGLMNDVSTQFCSLG